MNRCRSGAALGLAAVLAIWAVPAHALEAPAVSFSAPGDGAVLTDVTVSGRAEMKSPLNRIKGIRVEVRSKIAGGDRVACVDGQCNVVLDKPSTTFSFSPPLAVNGPYEVTASATGVEVVDIDGPETAGTTRAFKLEAKPAAPADVRAEANPDRTITVSWARNRERDLIGYQVQRKGPGASAFAVVDSVAQSSGARLSLVDRKPAETGGAFEYVVLAVRRGADGTNANPVSAASAPSGVVTVAGPDGRIPPTGGSPPGGAAGRAAVLDVPSFLSKAGADGPNPTVPGGEAADAGVSEPVPMAVPGSDDAALGDNAEVALEEESTSSERRAILIPIAAGLLLCLLAGHLRWFSRRTSTSSEAAEPRPGPETERAPETEQAPDERQWTDAVEAPAGTAAASADRRRRGRRRSHLGDEEVSQVVLGSEIDDLLAADSPAGDRRGHGTRPEPVAVPADAEGAGAAASFPRPGDPVEVGKPGEQPTPPTDQAVETRAEPVERPAGPPTREGRRSRRAPKEARPERDEDLDARFEVLVTGAEADLDDALDTDRAAATAGSAAPGVAGEQAPPSPPAREDTAARPDADASSWAAEVDSAADAATARATLADAAAEAASSRAAAAEAAAEAATSRATAADAAAEAATSRATAAAIETAAIEAAAIEAAATIQAAAAAEAAAAKEAAATIEAAAGRAAAEATQAAIAAATIAATEAATEAATIAATETAAAEATSAAVAAATIEATEAAVAAATIAATEAAVAAATIEATEAAIAAATEAAIAAATDAAVAAATSAVGAAMVAMAETTAAEESSGAAADGGDTPGGDDVGAGDVPEEPQEEEEGATDAGVTAPTPSAFGFGEEAVTAVVAEEPAAEASPEEPPPPERTPPRDEWSDLLDPVEQSEQSEPSEEAEEPEEPEEPEDGTGPPSAGQSPAPPAEPVVEAGDDDAAGDDDGGGHDDAGGAGGGDSDGGEEGDAPEGARPPTAAAGDTAEPDDDAWDSVVLVGGDPPPERDSPVP